MVKARVDHVTQQFYKKLEEAYEEGVNAGKRLSINREDNILNMLHIKAHRSEIPEDYISVRDVDLEKDALHEFGKILVTNTEEPFPTRFTPVGWSAWGIKRLIAF